MELLAIGVSEKIEEGDVKGAIRLAASEETVAPYCRGTIDALIRKHPCRKSTLSTSRQLRPPDTSVTSLSLQESAIAAAIKTFPNGSAGGLDGLRPQHLKDMISIQHVGGSQNLGILSQLTEFVNICLSGRTPTVIRPVFFGALLHALKKKDGGVRPIAVGCTLRRLIAKAACYSVSERIADQLCPLQLGFGVKQGTEAASHAARCYVNNLKAGQGFLKIDFTNAFNTVNRDELFNSAASFIPEMLQ